MNRIKGFEQEIYGVNDGNFDDIAITLFQFQAEHNPVYRLYLNHLGVGIQDVKSIDQIPFLPISFFRNNIIKTGDWTAEAIFLSSGTTSTTQSENYIRSLNAYRENTARCFETFFDSLEHYHFMVFVPYRENHHNSSLLTMLNYFVERSGSDFSGFYYDDVSLLMVNLEKARRDGRTVIVWGVSFALLELADQVQVDLSGCIVMETGGMKGRRPEITRQELHSVLREKLNNPDILSEYGMTELISQAYLNGPDRKFGFPAWARVRIREITDPLNHGLLGQVGGVNIIDLANWNTISFIETQDLGKIFDYNAFEIVGRMDNSDQRGCNLLIS